MVRKVRLLLARPQFDIVVFVLILFSVVTLVLEVVSEEPDTQAMFESAGLWITVLFWIELTLRYVGATNRASFFREYWIDLLAVVPIPAIPSLRALRLLRLLRVLRLFRAGIIMNRRFSRVTGTFFEGSGELFFIGFIVFMVVVFGSTGMYFVHRHLDGKFPSFEDALWFSLFTMLAGEPIEAPPYSTVGRAIALIVAFSGMTVFALFVGVVTAVMSERLRRHLEATSMDLESLENHILVCGWNPSAYIILERVLSVDPRGSAIVVVAERPLSDRRRDGNGGMVYHLVGDPTRIDVLRQAGVERARMAILLADASVTRSDQDRDARSVLTALMVEKLNPRIQTCVELLNSENEAHIREAGIENIIVPTEWGAHLMSSLAVHEAIAMTIEELLDRNRGNSFHLVDPPADLVGMPFGNAVLQLKRTHDVLLVGIQDAPAPAVPTTARARTRVSLNPPADRVIAAGNQLVVMSVQPPDLHTRR